MSHIDDLYEWTKRAINDCKKQSQAEMCGELIDIFEKRNPPEYLIKSLRELLKIVELSVISQTKIDDTIQIKEKVWEMYNAGHSPKEISELLDINYQYCIDIMNRKRKAASK